MRKLMSFSDSFICKIFNRIQHTTEISEWHASLFRIVFGIFILLFATPFYGWMGDVPQGFFNPKYLSPARLYTGFPSGEPLAILDFLIVVAAVFITLGIRVRLAGLAFVALYIFGASFEYSFGKIDHTILVPLTLLCFSFSNWGSQNALVPDKLLSFHAYAPAMLAIFISFGMFTAGFEKLLVWVDFDLSTSGFLSWFAIGYFDMGRQFVLSSLVFDFPILMVELLDYSAVAFELSPFLFLLAGPKYWRSWLLVASAFHLGNACLLNIPFHIHTVIYGAFFLSPLLNRERLQHSAQLLTSIKVLFLVSIALGITHIVQRFTSDGANFLFIPRHLMERDFELYVAILLWIITLIAGLFSLLSHFKRPENVVLEESGASEYLQVSNG